MLSIHRSKAARILPVGAFVTLLVLLVAAPAAAQNVPPDPPEPEEVVDVAIAGWNPALGPADAPVTLVVFTEYLCPFCKRLEPVLAQLRAAYGDRIRIVYRFRRVHPGADELAAAALAAHKQGKFRAFHERLFENQELLRERPNFPLRLARQLGLDVAQFRADLAGESIRKQVEGDAAEAERLGVNGVPTTYINGRELTGAQQVEKFGEVIDRLLGITTPTVFTPPEPPPLPPPPPAGTGEGTAAPPPPVVPPPAD